MRLTDLIKPLWAILEGPDLLPIMLNKFPKLREVITKYTNPDTLKIIGQCSKGTAFSDGNIVVKVTEDGGEALAAANMIKQRIPGYVNTYEVGKFSGEIPYQDIGDDEPITTQYYVIIQDKLDTKLNPREEEVLDLLGRFLSDKKVTYPLNVTAIINNTYVYGYQRDHKIYKSPISDNILLQILSIMNNLWKKRGIELGDVRSDNVGKDKNGNLTIFDPGLSRSPRVQIQMI